MTNQYASNEPYATISSLPSESYSEIKDYYDELRDNDSIRYINNLMYICRKLRFNRNLYDDSLEDAIPKLFLEIADLSCSPFQEVFKAWNEGRLTFTYKDGTDYDKHNGYDNNYYIDRYIVDNYVGDRNIYMVYIDINNRLSIARFNKSSNPKPKSDNLLFNYIINHMKYVKDVCDNKALNYKNTYYNTKLLFKSIFGDSNKDWKKANILSINYNKYEEEKELLHRRLSLIMEIIPEYDFDINLLADVIEESHPNVFKYGNSDTWSARILIYFAELANEGKLRKKV